MAGLVHSGGIRFRAPQAGEISRWTGALRSSPAGYSVGFARLRNHDRNDPFQASDSGSGLAIGCRGSRWAMWAAIDSGNRRMRRL